MNYLLINGPAGLNVEREASSPSAPPPAEIRVEIACWTPNVPGMPAPTAETPLAAAQALAVYAFERTGPTHHEYRFDRLEDA